MKRSLSLLGLLVLGAAHAEPLTIATLLPMSGTYARNGQEIANGAELAVRRFEADFKKLGFELRLSRRDDEASVSKATTEARRLLGEADVMGVLSSYTSGITMPVSDVLSEGDLAQTCIGTASAVTDRGLANISRVVARNDAQGAMMAKYLQATAGAKRVFVISDATTYGNGLAQDFATAAQSLGLTVAGRSSVMKRDGFAGLAAQVKAAKPDYIYLGGAFDSSALILKGLRANGVTQPVAGGDTLNDKAFFKTVGPLMKDVIFTDTFGFLNSFSSGATFRAQYKAAFKTEPTALAMFGYDSALALVQGLKAAVEANGGRKPERANVAASVRGLTTTGLTGPIGFDAKGDRRGAPVFVIRYDPATFTPKVLQLLTRN